MGWHFMANMNDASKLTFPRQLVITLVSTIVSIIITVMATTWSMQSDIRDIATRMELREEIYEVSKRTGEDKPRLLQHSAPHAIARKLAVPPSSIRKALPEIHPE